MSFKFHCSVLLSSIALSCAATGAQAASPGAAAVVTSATQGAVVMDKSVTGPSPNVQAILAHLKSNPKQRIVLWLVDGKYVVSGALFSTDGGNLSEKMAIQEGLIPKPLTGAQAFDLAAKAHSFVIGKSGPEVTAFEDPNCSACHQFGTSVNEEIEAGKLRVRVIPVGFLKPDSVGRAAAILSSKEPSASWRSNESTFDVKTEEGGFPVGHPTPESFAQVKANTALLSQVNQGQIATPTILYCDKVGAAKIARGWSPEILSNLGTAGCMPR